MNSSTGTPHLVRDIQFNDMTTIFDEMTMRQYVQKRAAESLIGFCLERLFFGHREILGRSRCLQEPDPSTRGATIRTITERG